MALLNRSNVVVAVAAFCVAGIAFADRKPDSRHVFMRPEVPPSVIANGCSAEIDAYASAVAIAESAADAAQDAYDALQDCLSERAPQHVEIPNSPSILVRD